MFPSPGDLPNPGVEPRSPTLHEDSLPAEPPGRLRILEWVAYAFSTGSSWPRNRTRVSCITSRFFTSWATRKSCNYFFQLHNISRLSKDPMMLKLKLQYFDSCDSCDSCDELTHLKIPCFWERLRAGGEGDNRGWDGWMASVTQWTWVWVNSGSW